MTKNRNLADLLNADGQIDNADIAGGVNFKNIIINGDMSIDQRNSGSSVTINATANIYTLDRWLGVGQPSDGVFTIEQDTDAPTGFTNCSKITVTTADASIGSTQLYLFSQFIEGNNMSYLGFGTSNAKTITLSFWVKSSLTGTFGGVINNSDNSRAYPFTYSISSANTWEKKSVTITGDTSGSGTYPTDNSRGMALRFQIGLGSSHVDTAGAWTASSAIYGATGATNIISTLNATWQITGVQLEAGTTASDFEFLPNDVNLRRCQRYYEVIADGSQLSVAQVMNATAYTSNNAYGVYKYREVMRATPSLDIVTGTAFYRWRSAGTNYTFDTITFSNGTNSTGRISIATGGGATAGYSGWITINAETTGFVALDAEL
jgi:hypothetical protein